MNPDSTGATARFDVLPAPLLVLLAIVAMQVGAALATQLFPALGPEGTVAVRILLSAMLLSIPLRGRLSSVLAACRLHARLLLFFGICIAAMNLCFYLSIARIPLGAAVAIEFIGPLGLAVCTSRQPSQFVWIAIAGLGIVLISPLSGTDLDLLGVVFALVAGLGWAAFIVFAQKVGELMPGNDGLAVGMGIAGIVMLPFAIPVAPVLAFDPWLALLGLGVALLSTTIPFTLEFHALKRLPPRNYGILVSLEPAVAALCGALILGERIGMQGVAAVVCVVVAAVGITLTKTSPQA